MKEKIKVGDKLFLVHAVWNELPLYKTSEIDLIINDHGVDDDIYEIKIISKKKIVSEKKLVDIK